MSHQVTAKGGTVARAHKSKHESFRYVTNDMMVGTYIFENFCVSEIPI